MKRFKSKKIKKRLNIRKSLIFIFLIFFYLYIFGYTKKNNFDKNILVKDIDYINFNIINYIKNESKKIINNPVNLLDNNIKKVNNKNNSVITVMKEEKESENILDEYKPIIYIYNTHQTEKYNNYSVVEAGELLTKKLNEIGFDTFYEEQSISVFLQENNFKYYKSYTGSRKYLMEAKEKYEGLTYFFDIHRDALKKEQSTLNFNGINYAKISFLVGLENKNYEGNLNNATRLNDIINTLIPGLSRGIIKKSGEGVNGVYNQDISSNVFLIEIGGNENNKEEVINTVEIIKNAIKEYIKGEQI